MTPKPTKFKVSVEYPDGRVDEFTTFAHDAVAAVYYVCDRNKLTKAKTILVEPA